MTEKEVFESIKYHKLHVCPEFAGLTEKSFKKIYNGYGPDSWRTGFRDTLTWIFGNFEEVAGSHDVSFHFSTGTRTGFNKTVSDWKKNSSKMLGAKYPMSSPTLWIHRSVAWGKLYLAQRAISGPSAYKFYIEAYQNRIDKPKAV